MSAVALLSGLLGCAALPNAADDIGCENKTTSADGGCGIIQGDAGAGSTDAQSPPDASYEGGFTAPQTRNSLCGGECSPDDATSCTIDGGTSDAGPEACRVVLGANQSTDATCSPTGQGNDGASCQSGADCAPGYECVGTGTCRHYCCEDDSCTTMTQNSTTYDTYFCDVGTEHASSGAKVPVCQVVVHCSPLKTDSCGPDQACTVVEIDSGSNFIATCDAVGTAKLGDSCETTHCAAGLACIGTIGQRVCQELCDNQNPCPANATCNMKSQALMQYGVGVCN
jgi:hypothetical protein